MPSRTIAMEPYTGSKRELLELLATNGAYLYLPNAESTRPRVRRRAADVSLTIEPARVAELEAEGFIRRDKCAWLVTLAGRAWLNGPGRGGNDG
jgi:hypothetical protein